MSKSGADDAQRPMRVSKDEFSVNWERTFGKQLSLDTTAWFSWGYADEWFLETQQYGNFLWSDPNYGGSNVITPYKGSHADWLKTRAHLPASRDRGIHTIRNRCGPEVKLP